MQRLARFKLEEINQNAAVLFEHYDEMLKIVRAHLPPSTATLFAKPEIKSDQVTVEWYSELEGQPYLVSEDEAGKATLQRISPLIQQRLNAITALTQSLTAKGAINAEQSAWLTQLVEGANHNTRQIYLVNNEPVITGWGIGKKVEPPAPPPPPPVVPVAAPKHRWCCWLLPLLLLLLGLLAWWWFNREPVVSPKVEPLKVEEPKKEEPKKEELKPEPPKEQPKVEEPKPEPVQEPVKEEPKVEEPVVEKAQESVEPPKEEPKQPPQKVCKPKYKPGETPQMVMIFDNSASMLYSLLESPQSIEAFNERWERYGVTETEIQYMQRLPNRLSTAKKSSASIINSIGKNVDIGLVSLKTCPAAINHGFYSPAKRGVLKAKIQAMKPGEEQSGTPLYNGLQVASSMVDGVKRDAFILILSDGKDNCSKADICSLAHHIAKQKPRLKVNVVDIGGARAANCVATATGGKVFTANNQKQVVSMINQAITPMTKTDECE